MTHIPPTNTRALYEIALAIKPRATLQATAEAALEAYRQQLDCDAAAVVEARPAPERDDPATETVATAPDDETFDRVAGDILSRLPRSPTRGEATLPVVEEKPETNRYGMALPGFGVLVLCKRGPPLAASVRESLPELNGKLAAVCNRVRFQSQYETQYRELFEDAPVMFALTREEDGQAVVEDCNHSFAETLGYDRETIRGTPLASFYTEGSAAQLRGEGYERALRSEFGTEERVLETRDGREITTVLRATPRRGRDGAVVGTYGLYVDVTELTRRNQQLSVFNRILRHNLRNNLNSVMGYHEMAAETADPTTRAHLANADESIEALRSIAEGAGRIQRILDEPELSRCDLGEVVESLVARARNEFPDATIESSVQPVSVRALDSLTDGLWELLENACVHAGDSPTVRVRLRADAEAATLTIADDGPGLPAQEVTSVVDGAETQLNHGSGLGLWMAKWVVEGSGGDIRFDAEDGSVARVRVYRHGD